MTEKMTGYVLLVIGLFVIGFAAISVYGVFKGTAVPFELFKFDAVSIEASALIGQPLPPGVEGGEVEIFPAEILNTTTNTVAHLFLMGFIASIGYKVAMIGGNLLRAIVVQAGPQKMKSVLDPKN